VEVVAVEEILVVVVVLAVIAHLLLENLLVEVQRQNHNYY
jgi:type II secretory pathway pseudopilin PulG